MGFYKRGWWKIKPAGSGNSMNAFGLMDELFHPTAHEAKLQIEEESRKVVVSENEDDSPKITIHLKKNINH